TLDQAIRMARRGGTICILGVYTFETKLNTMTAYTKELTITWANSYATWDGRSEYALALDLLATGRIRAEPLITHHYSLDQVNPPFAAAADKRASGAIKVLVHP